MSAPVEQGGGADGRADDADAGRTFEDLMAELEQVTETLAAGELGIEAAADLYERAQKLHALASERLGQVQERVERLAAGDQGRPPAGGTANG